MLTKIKLLTASALALRLGLSAVNAAVITWGAPANIANDTDVSTNGTAAYAYDWGGRDEVVNGVTFTASVTPGGGTNVGITSAGLIDNNTGAFSSATAPFGTLSPAYQGILTGADFADSANEELIVTLSNLVTGELYAVQMWVSDPRGAPEDARNETNNGGGNTVVLAYSANQAQGSPGQYAIGSFTADGPIQSFTLEGAASTQLNALQVRATPRNASITYVGTQYDLGPGWRTSTTNKPLDIDGNNVLGTDGYNMVNLAEVLPAYVSADQILSSTFPGDGGYASIDDPDNLPNLFLTGTMNPDPGTGTNADFYSFTLNSNAFGRTIRVGLMVDNLDGSAFNSLSMEIIQTNRNLADSGPVATLNEFYNDRIPDWIFFDIANAAAGDGFVIEGIGGTNGTATLGGVAFDSVPVGLPQARTLPATVVYATTATLNATVNPNGAATQYYFEYGPTASYGNVTVTNSLIAGIATLNISNVLTGLTPGTAFYYQVVAVNSAGSTNGGQLDFTTGVARVVSTDSDNGAGSLRTAIAQAGANDVITFANTLAGSTIRLTGGQILLPNNLTIDGSALSNGVVINGNANGRIFYVDIGATVVLDSLTITNGMAGTADGGGIFNNGTLTLNQCTVSGNSTSNSADGGGAIFTIGTLTLNQCTVSGNSATDSDGGGIFNLGTLALNQCTLSGNTASNEDGGGAIFNSGGTLTLNQCTLSGNSAPNSDGGGIFNNGPLTLDQCTLSGNTCTNDGGGIFNYSGATSITNSIVAGNSASIGLGGDIYNESTTFTYGGANIVEDAVSADAGIVTGTTPINADPGLEALGNYGGPTQTMLPVTNSPAIDAGIDSPNSFATDQRGYPRLSGLHVDIGADELQQAAAVTLPASDITTTNATLNGTVSPGELTTTWYFQYGTTTSYGNNSSMIVLSPGFNPVAVSNTLDDLAPATIYHYQTVANDGVSAKFGADVTFSTLDAAPSIEADSAVGYATTALFLATINPNGADTQYYFEYGPTTNYGFFTATNILPAGNAPVKVSEAVTGLTPGAGYFYRLVTSNSLGLVDGGPNGFTDGHTLVVTTNSDDGGAGTLRTIVSNAVSGSTITFTNTLSGSTILLTNGGILLSRNLSIDASALANPIIINGNANGRIFEVQFPETVVLSSLIITNGSDNTGNGGGGIYNNYTLTLNQCTLSGNSATNAFAGGIYNSVGTLTLNQCTLSGNSCSNGDGGGIFNFAGTLTLNRCTLSGNSCANEDGGGIFSQSGTVILNQCTVSGNSALEEDGGGIFNLVSKVTLNQCTVSGNSATNGGGGGIFAQGGTTSINNSIVTGNIDNSSGGADINLDSSALTYGGSNIVEFVSDSGGTIDGTTPINSNPELAVLGNYGGPTQTMLPMTNSPAIDADDDSATNFFATDQRGLPRLSGLHVDIGAVELQQAAPTTLPASDITATNATINASFAPIDLAATWYFQYGTSTNYGASSPTNTLNPGLTSINVSNALTNLAPATTYHYQILASDGLSIKTGADVAFTTLDAAPSAATDPATSVFATTATLTATINPNGAVTEYYFQYGPTVSYGFFTATHAVPAGNMPVSVSSVLTNLTPGAAIYYQVVTSNSVGAEDGAQIAFTNGNLLVVTTNSDDGSSGTLRSVVANAASSDTITFANTLSGTTILLTGGQIMLANNLAIDASALGNGIVINGLASGRIFNMNNGAAVVLDSLTITNGSVLFGVGGGIYNNGTLTLNQCTLSGNSAQEDDGGGGIYNDGGTLTLNQCILSGNSAPDSFGGGGIGNYNGTVALNQCTLSGNSASNTDGGGLLNDGGAVTLSQCTLSGNSASRSDGGGGIYNNSTLTLHQCTLSGNMASNSDGGGILNAGTLTLNQCTLSGNSADPPVGGGGGIFNSGTLALNQCTLSANSASNSDGGGILNDGTMAMTNSIVAGNGAVSGAGADIYNNFSPLTYGGSNIVGAVSNINGTITGTTPIVAGPNLQPLGNYGGPTQTMPPMTNSPAVDAGSDSATNFFATDQRGYPRLSGLHVDIGAVELQQATATTLPASNITGTNATGNGTVTPNELETTWYFQYGTNTAYGSFSATNILAPGFSPASVRNFLDGLAPDTIYHYQILANDGVSTKFGADTTFSTQAIPPLATTGPATNIGPTTATLDASINPGGAATAYYFEYGTTTNYGFFTPTNTEPAGGSVVNVSDFLTNLTPALVYHYQVVAVNSAGTNAGGDLTFTNLKASIVIIDSEIVVAITSPANKLSTTNSSIAVKGTIKGSGANPLLQVTVNSNTPVFATNGATTHGTIAWSSTVPLVPGPNVITAQTIDTNGTEVLAAPATVTVFYVTNLPSAKGKSTLTLAVSPANSGKISGQKTLASLETNKVYTVTAAPLSGWVFINWTDGGTNTSTVLGTNESLSFIMTPNLVLQANFITNQFSAVDGVYNGLFSPAAGASENTSGFFTATVAATGTGAYSGKLLLDGGSYSFSGTFNLSGDSEATVARTGQPPVEVILHLNLPAPDDQMTGYVVDFASNGWTSELLANRAVFSKSSPATNYVGKYTLVIPPASGSPTNSPGGYSYATLANTSAGLVTLGGTLADKSAISQSTSVSKDGNIPLYVSLYSKKGSLQGWLTLTNETTNQTSPLPTILGTNLAWFKAAVSGPLYSAGFTNTNLSALGSLYTGGFTLAGGTLILSNGNLAAQIFTNVSVTGNKLLSSDSVVLGTIAPATGAVTLTLKATDTAPKITAKGVILQDAAGTNAAGWFPGTNESGYFLLQP
jgi:hypothetical protein